MEDQELTLLSFQIQDDVFAVDALQVDHILEVPTKITNVPNTPDYMKGIINLHGNIIPVADMRVIMNCENIENGADTSIIVINPKNVQDGRIGILVDMVKEVIETNSNKLSETIIDENKGLIDYFLGTLTIDNEFIHIIDIKHLTEVIEK